MATKAKSQADRAKKQIAVRKAYQSVFSGPLGTLVLHDLMREHDILSTPKSLDPQHLAYVAGEQAVIKRILAYMNTNISNMEERVQAYVREMET